MSNAREAVLDAIAARRSIRAFRSTAVPRETLVRILDVAARAPSGTNIQPWQAIVLTGEALRRFVQQLSAHALSGAPTGQEYAYYPKRWREPYLARRRKVGRDLYGVLGIARGDQQAIARQHARNYAFFDAPVGIIFTMDRDMEIGSWLDLGMFLQNVMIAARAFGMDTCLQAAFAHYEAVVARLLEVPLERRVVLGMALGYRNEKAPENNFGTEREPAETFAVFLDALPEGIECATHKIGSGNEAPLHSGRD